MKNKNVFQNKKSKEKQRDSYASKTYFDNIRSKYIIQRIFDNVPKNKLFKIILINKKLKQRIDIDKKDYVENCFIVIEIVPAQNIYGKFINIINEKDKKYFNIYFNDKNEKIERTFLYKNEKVQNIKIKINPNMINFTRLFEKCKCVEKIILKYLKPRYYYEMNKIFNECISLKEIH